MNSGIIFLGLIYWSVGAVQAQNANPDVLTNDAVIGMVKAGLSPNLIISTINTNGCNFQLDADKLITLKQADVPDQVLRVMLLKECKAGTAPDKTLVDRASGIIQGSLTRETKKLGHTTEARAIIVLLKGAVEIPADSYVTITDNVGVSAPADASCVSAARPASATPTQDEAIAEVRALAACGAMAVKNQAGARTYEILKRTVSDQSGHFEMINITPGEYTLLVKSHTEGRTVRDMMGKMLVVRVKIETGKTFDLTHHFGAPEW
jgi:hypothetical protein